MSLYAPGESGKPNGRPKGARNRRTQEVLDLIQGRGDTDPLDALSAIVTTNKDPNIVATAANMLAPFVHSKRGTVPAPRFIPEPIEVPKFSTLDQAEDYLNDLSVRLGRGEIDSQSAIEIGGLIKQWMDSRRAAIELDLKIAAQGGHGDATIRIEGGLPLLPGTSVIMDDTAVGRVIEHDGAPALNGHNGHQAQAPAIDAEPTQSEAGEP
jgi:hypothetical protein